MRLERVDQSEMKTQKGRQEENQKEGGEEGEKEEKEKKGGISYSRIMKGIKQQGRN